MRTNFLHPLRMCSTIARSRMPAGSRTLSKTHELRCRKRVGVIRDFARQSGFSALVIVAGVCCLVSGSFVGASSASVGWQRLDIFPVTQPAGSGDRFLFYARSKEGLRVVALDAQSGATAWSAAATPSRIAPGVPPQLAVDGRTAIYLRYIVGRLAQMVAADARTGRELWKSDFGEFKSWPAFCPDSTQVICITGTLIGPFHVGVGLRFDVRTGRLLAGPRVASSPIREVAPGLFSPQGRQPELLVAARGAAVLWRRSLVKIFTPQSSTDWGWNLDRISRLGLFVGSVGWAPVRYIGGRAVMDMSKGVTVGFRINDGRVIWRMPGIYACDYLPLPCPGASQIGFSTPSDSGVSPEIGIRIHARGSVTEAETGVSTAVVSKDAAGVLEGFDLATGQSLWRFRIGPDAGLLSRTLLPPQTATNTVLLRDRSLRIRSVDLRTGLGQAVSRHSRGWCRARTQYRAGSPYREGGGASYLHSGQLAVFPCTATRQRVPTPALVPSFLAAIGGYGAGMVAWSDKRGIFARSIARRGG